MNKAFLAIVLAGFCVTFSPQAKSLTGNQEGMYKQITYSAVAGLASAALVNLVLLQKGQLTKIIVTPVIALTVMLSVFLVLHDYYDYLGKREKLMKGKQSELDRNMKKLELALTSVDEPLSQEVFLSSIEQATLVLNFLLKREEDRFSRLILDSIQERLNEIQNIFENKKLEKQVV